MFKEYELTDNYLKITVEAIKDNLVKALIEEFFGDKYSLKWINKHNAYVIYEYEPFCEDTFYKIYTVYFENKEEKSKVEFMVYLLDKYKDFLKSCESNLYPVQE